MFRLSGLAWTDGRNEAARNCDIAAEMLDVILMKMKMQPRLKNRIMKSLAERVKPGLRKNLGRNTP